MILPPLYGFVATKYNERDIYQAIVDYLTSDAMTYVVPTADARITYISVDTLTYIRSRAIAANVTYLTSDVLTYDTQQSNACNLSYMTCDVLCYEFPPTVPSAIALINVREKDSLGIFSWDPPEDGKSSIQDYIVEYQQQGDSSWTSYNDGVNTNTGLSIPFTNGNTYRIQIAAVNARGTGPFAQSDYITPSGGIDVDCDMVAYVNLNQADRNNMNVYGCRPGELFITNDMTFGTTSAGVFGTNYWDFPGTQVSITDSNSPNYGQSTYPHIHISGLCEHDWSLVGDFTVSLWFKPDSASATQECLIGASSESDNTTSWDITHDNDDIVFNISGITIVQATGLNISTSNFTHVVVCRSQDYISLYIDGVEKDEQYYCQNTYIYSDFLILGAKPYTDQYNFSNYDGWGIVVNPFAGALDEIIISRSAFYRGDFTSPSSEHSESFTCTSCTTCPTISLTDCENQ